MYSETYWIVVDDKHDLIWLERSSVSKGSKIPCIFQTEKDLVNFFRMNDNGWYEAEVDTKKKKVEEWDYIEVPTNLIVKYL